MKVFYLLLLFCSPLWLRAQNVTLNQGFQLFPSIENTLIGPYAGIQITTATRNSFLGINAGYNTTTGSYNSFMGCFAGYSNTTGSANLFAGQRAGFANSTAAYNTFMGNSSGQSTTTGDGNTAVGDGSLLSNVMGTNNTAIGRYAGLNIIAGSNNTFIGTFATAPSGNSPINNATAIGYNAQVTVSNSVILGNEANVGIGNTAPSAKLHITTGAANTSGLRLENLTSNSSLYGNTNQFLTVDASGNVVLAGIISSKAFRSVAGLDSASLWSSDGLNLHNANAGAVVIGQNVNTTPTGYKLYVEQGILTEKVKVALKNTSEWSDHVFAPTYKLPSLSQVEAQIQQTGHLPGVPSAQQMVEQGNDLHKTDAKLLEKIEELTLYSIQLEKADQAKQVELPRQGAQMNILIQEVEQLKQLVKQLVEKK